MNKELIKSRLKDYLISSYESAKIREPSATIPKQIQRDYWEAYYWGRIHELILLLEESEDPDALEEIHEQGGHLEILMDELFEWDNISKSMVERWRSLIPER